MELSLPRISLSHSTNPRLLFALNKDPISCCWYLTSTYTRIGPIKGIKTGVNMSGLSAGNQRSWFNNTVRVCLGDFDVCWYFPLLMCCCCCWEVHLTLFLWQSSCGKRPQITWYAGCNISLYASWSKGKARAVNLALDISWKGLWRSLGRPWSWVKVSWSRALNTEFTTGPQWATIGAASRPEQQHIVASVSLPENPTTSRLHIDWL